jgi:thiol-disulfide isomerase/thioredoxin
VNQHRPEPEHGRRRRAWLKAAFAAVLVTVLVGVAAAVAFSGGTSSASRSTAGASRDRASVAAARGANPLVLEGTDLITGQRISLASFKGKPIVLNFWASSCGACISEARALALFERAHPEAQVIGVDVQDSRSSARAWAKRFGWHHPNVFDPTGALTVRLGVEGLPTTYFLDRQHRVVARILGKTDLAGFSNGLRRVTA